MAVFIILCAISMLIPFKATTENLKVEQAYAKQCEDIIDQMKA